MLEVKGHSLTFIFSVHETVEECVKSADFVVLATFASEPILFRYGLLRPSVIIIIIN